MKSQVSQTTYYRRLRKARDLGCPITELPDNRGRHGNHAKGSSHPRWNKGRLQRMDGYILVRIGVSHLLADPNGYGLEHLLVWVSAGNARPSENEVMHHINGDKQDNRIENLSCIARSEHNRIHNMEQSRGPDGRFLGKNAGRLLDGVDHSQIPEVGSE